MKIGLKTWLPFLLLCPLLLVSPNTNALIRFNAESSIRIDLEKLQVSRQTFFDYVTGVIHKNPFGLQAYGLVPFSICDMKLKGRRLIDYETPQGRQVRFISNPSCAQIVLSRVLELNYGYKPDNLESNDNRKCIRNVESIFSPMLEYYTIQYEDKTRPDCERCDDKERNRLDRISRLQQKIGDNCGSEQKKVVNFLNDLDRTVEKAYQTKKEKKR